MSDVYKELYKKILDSPPNSIKVSALGINEIRETSDIVKAEQSEDSVKVTVSFPSVTFMVDTEKDFIETCEDLQVKEIKKRGRKPKVKDGSNSTAKVASGKSRRRNKK